MWLTICLQQGSRLRYLLLSLGRLGSLPLGEWQRGSSDRILYWYNTIKSNRLFVWPHVNLYWIVPEHPVQDTPNLWIALHERITKLGDCWSKIPLASQLKVQEGGGLEQQQSEPNYLRLRTGFRHRTRGKGDNNKELMEEQDRNCECDIW